METKKEKPYHVRVTEENIDVLSKWRDAKLTLNHITGMCLNNHNSELTKEHNPYTNIKNDTYNFGEEISFEEFCKRENIPYINKQFNNLIVW